MSAYRPAESPADENPANLGQEVRQPAASGFWTMLKAVSLLTLIVSLEALVVYYAILASVTSSPDVGRPGRSDPFRFPAQKAPKRPG